MADLQKRALARLPNASPKSLKYLDSLLIDLGFYASHKVRNDYLSRETNREIKTLVDLKQHEVSRLIGELKERKARNKEREEHARVDYDDSNPY